jgi:ribosomal protein S18 acetylase RimI-like enzyme
MKLRTIYFLDVSQIVAQRRTGGTMEFQMSRPEQDDVLIRHYLAIWESYGTPADDIVADAKQRIKAFIDEGRMERQLATFLAVAGGVPVGSASCQLHISPYPNVIKSAVRKHGYIWSVFVEPSFRRRGVSRELTRMAIEYLKSIGCTAAVLHASDIGQSGYASLGFKIAKEMRLKFN